MHSHGDVLAIADEFGEIKKSYTYDAYGKEQLFNITPQGENTLTLVWKAETERIYNPFRYCGEYADSETGMIYLRNRYYDPSIGRFITEDPAKDGLNWYVYCGGNPIMYVDPWGNIREPGYVDGVWCENPDEYEFGKDSIVFSSLVTLGEMWKIKIDDRNSISRLANEVRKIGRQKGINKIIKSIRTIVPDSANATDVVIAAGNINNARLNFKAMKHATRKADELYINRADGTQHNALKHAMWNALLTKYVNSDYAKIVADAHEFGAEENYKQDTYQQNLMSMDLWNNAKGRELGRTFKKSHWYGDYDEELSWKIVSLINEGSLWVIDWRN